MTSKLGVYWSTMHRRAQDYDYFKQLQPSVFKVMDGGPPDYSWANGNLPNSLIIARDWALSEQHDDMLRNPEATGIRHAQEWNDKVGRLGLDRGRTLVLGINEPRVWEAGVAEALRIYTIALCDAARQRNLRVGAMQLGVGWPNNTGPDTPPDWSPWHGVEDAIKRGNHALVTHEYWADRGPAENWGWWGGRTLRCPWQVPIVIGECGIDMFVKSAQFEGNRGWQGHVSPEQYAKELADYTGRMSADSRFVGCCVFTSDFASHEWWSFDVEPAYQAILATPIPVPEPPTQDWEIISPPETAYVGVRAGANIRTQPVNGAVIVAVPYREAVSVSGKDKQTGWLRVTYQNQTGWMSPGLVTATQPAPPVVTPPVEPVGDAWRRSYAFVREWEGGWADHPSDPGGPTMRGITLDTYTRWRLVHSLPAPTKDDLRAITDAEVERIMFEWYWKESGADALPWPLCLAHFDTAVNAGVGRARDISQRSSGNFLAYMGNLIDWYTRIANFETFGRAWIRRRAALLLEASR